MHPDEWRLNRNAFVAWTDICITCAALQNARHANRKDPPRGLRIFLRRAWSITRAEIDRLDRLG